MNSHIVWRTSLTQKQRHPLPTAAAAEQTKGNYYKMHDFDMELTAIGCCEGKESSKKRALESYLNKP